MNSKQGQTNWNACHLEESLFFVMGHKIIIKELGFLSLLTLCSLQNELLISSESLLYDFCCYNLWSSHGLFLTINCHKFIVSFMKYISYTWLKILDCINEAQVLRNLNNTKYSRSTVNLSYIQKYVGIIFIFDLLLWWRYMVLYNFMQVSFNKKVSRPKWTLSYPHQPTCMCIYIWSIYLELVHYVFATLLILL